MKEFNGQLKTDFVYLFIFMEHSRSLVVGRNYKLNFYGFYREVRVDNVLTLEYFSLKQSIYL